MGSFIFFAVQDLNS